MTGAILGDRILNDPGAIELGLGGLGFLIRLTLGNLSKSYLLKVNRLYPFEFFVYLVDKRHVEFGGDLAQLN